MPSYKSLDCIDCLRPEYMCICRTCTVCESHEYYCECPQGPTFFEAPNMRDIIAIAIEDVFAKAQLHHPKMKDDIYKFIDDFTKSGPSS